MQVFPVLATKKFAGSLYIFLKKVTGIYFALVNPYLIKNKLAAR